ncbi:hypothetical protein Air01nite_41240 [Asanoa iriomotensis]|uniref:Uncharacterized protein n=1 Tax=Asanoa iriomotensis TaxID=234613 RepID=A0ABQ4C5I6_9ACTN|nr:hypothetical protein Air01nite_41240 [Asanoa iriomotensis]
MQQHRPRRTIDMRRQPRKVPGQGIGVPVVAQRRRVDPKPHASRASAQQNDFHHDTWRHVTRNQLTNRHVANHMQIRKTDNMEI